MVHKTRRPAVNSGLRGQVRADQLGQGGELRADRGLRVQGVERGLDWKGDSWACFKSKFELRRKGLHLGVRDVIPNLLDVLTRNGIFLLNHLRPVFVKSIVACVWTQKPICNITTSSRAEGCVNKAPIRSRKSRNQCNYFMLQSRSTVWILNLNLSGVLVNPMWLFPSSAACPSATVKNANCCRRHTIKSKVSCKAYLIN